MIVDMNKHIQVVRAALESAEWTLLMVDDEGSADECREALTALTAHEQEVRLLLQAARDIAEHNMTYFGEDASTTDPGSLWSKVRFLRSALRPFTGEQE